MKEEALKVRVGTVAEGFEYKAQSAKGAAFAETEQLAAVVRVFFGQGVHLVHLRFPDGTTLDTEPNAVDEEPDALPWPPKLDGIDLSRTCRCCGCKAVEGGVCTQCGATKVFKHCDD
jgi:hypothetical protein